MFYGFVCTYFIEVVKTNGLTFSQLAPLRRWAGKRAPSLECWNMYFIKTSKSLNSTLTGYRFYWLCIFLGVQDLYAQFQASLLTKILLIFPQPVLAGVDCHTHGVTVSLLPLTPWYIPHNGYRSLIYSYWLQSHVFSTLRLKYIHVFEIHHYSVSKCYKNKKHLNDDVQFSICVVSRLCDAIFVGRFLSVPLKLKQKKRYMKNSDFR